MNDKHAMGYYIISDAYFLNDALWKNWKQKMNEWVDPKWAKSAEN